MISQTHARTQFKALVEDPTLTPLKRLERLSAAQGGLFTSRQAQRLGVKRTQQAALLQAGAWLEHEHGVLGVRDVEVNPHLELALLCLWSRDEHDCPQAVVSHDTALRLHGLLGQVDSRIHLTVPPGFRRGIPPGVVLHQGVLRRGDLSVCSGVWLTHPLCTLLDMARDGFEQGELERVTRQALQNRQIHPAALVRELRNKRSLLPRFQAVLSGVDLVSPPVPLLPLETSSRVLGK